MERLRLDFEIRRKFIRRPREERQSSLRRRTYYSPMDAAFVL